MRQVRDMVRMLAKIFFGKNTATYEYQEGLQEENSLDRDIQKADKLYSQLIHMVDKGSINEAENLLSDELDQDQDGCFEVALGFYDYLNTLSDEFLEEHNYSREEIKDGAQGLADLKGLGGLGEGL